MKRSTRLAMIFGAVIMFGSAAFAQKQCELAISAATSTATINYGDTCFFDITFTNNGPANLTPMDSIYIRCLIRNPRRWSSLHRVFPTATVAPGGTQTIPKAAYVKHYFDTLTLDHQMDVCLKRLDGSEIPSTGFPNPNPFPVTYKDSVDANDSTCITVTFKKTTVGIFEFGGEDKEQLSIFPNPATGNVMFNPDLTKAVNVQVSVKDVAGREVMRKDFGKIQAGNTAPLSLDISRLQAGMYFIEMTGEEKRAVGKFTKR